MNDLMLIPMLQSKDESVLEIVCTNLTSNIITILIIVILMWFFEPFIRHKVNDSKLEDYVKYWLMWGYKTTGLMILFIVIIFISFI